MLPGLMIFINGTVVEYNKNQAEELYPGEFDMTDSVCDLGKFKLEAHWCAKEDVKNSTFGWGIYIAYRESNIDCGEIKKKVQGGSAKMSRKGPKTAGKMLKSIKIGLFRPKMTQNHMF